MAEWVILLIIIITVFWTESTMKFSVVIIKGIVKVGQDWLICLGFPVIYFIVHSLFNIIF